jgi:hypothetical protein
MWLSKPRWSCERIVDVVAVSDSTDLLVSPSPLLRSLPTLPFVLSRGPCIHKFILYHFNICDDLFSSDPMFFCDYIVIELLEEGFLSEHLNSAVVKSIRGESGAIPFASFVSFLLIRLSRLFSV